MVGRKKFNIVLGADGKIAKAILYTFIKTNIISLLNSCPTYSGIFLCPLICD